MSGYITPPSQGIQTPTAQQLSEAISKYKNRRNAPKPGGKRKSRRKRRKSHRKSRRKRKRRRSRKRRPLRKRRR